VLRAGSVRCSVLRAGSVRQAMLYIEMHKTVISGKWRFQQSVW
jgi:hypothetical protein